jgi:hypothetical protein
MVTLLYLFKQFRYPCRGTVVKMCQFFISLVAGVLNLELEML